MATETKIAPRQQRALDQGREWVNGRSRHNTVDNECCPDFSCCEPALFIQDRAERVVEYNRYAERFGAEKIVDA